MKSKKGGTEVRTVQLIAILHHLVDIKYLFRGGMSTMRRGRLLKFRAVLLGLKNCFKLPEHLRLYSLLKRLKNHAQIDVSCSGLTGQTKQILHGKGI